MALRQRARALLLHIGVSITRPSFPSPHPLLFSTTATVHTDTVNDICRALSDHRLPHHDLESALAPFAPHLSVDLLPDVLRRCVHLPLSSLRFFLWSSRLISPSPDSHHILLHSLARHRLFPLFWDVLRNSPPPLVDLRHAFHLLLRSYCQSRLPSDALRAFATMESDFGVHPTPDDFHQLLINLSANCLMDDAVTVLADMRSRFGNDLKANTILMKGWIDFGHPEDAVKMFNEMLDSQTPPDLVMYNTYMCALCEMGELEKAYAVPHEMKARGMEPDASTYSVLLRAHCKVDDADAVDRLMHMMRRKTLVPNVFTYNCVVKMFCRTGKVDNAYDVLDEMVERGAKPDIWSYNTIMLVHCKQREVNRGLRLLRRMYEEDSCLPDMHTYNMLLKMLIEVGRFDRMEEVWDGMGKKGFFPSTSTYAVMIHGLCKKKGKAEDARKYFEQMVEEGLPPYRNTCEVLRDCLMRSGLEDNIYVVRSKMQRSTSCAIQELANVMVSTRRRRRRRRGRREACPVGEDYEHSGLMD